MILGRNIEQDQMTCHMNDNSGFFTCGVISPFLFEIDLSSAQ